MRLVTPEGDDVTRPTQDRIKETLFNMLQMDVPGAVFVDAFAGSGGIGIEALSRGAARCYFIENGREPIKCITENLHKTHFEEKATLLKQDIVVALGNVRESHVDIVYIDPPYQGGLYERTLSALARMPYVDEDTLVLCEAAIKEDLSFLEDIGWTCVREKDYKTNKHLFLRRSQA